MLGITTKSNVLQAMLSADRSSSLRPIIDQYLTVKRNSTGRTWGQACDKIGDLELYLLEPDNLKQLVAVGISYERLSNEFVAFRKLNGLPRSELFTPRFSTPLTQLSAMERGRLLGYTSRRVVPPPTRKPNILPAYQETENKDVPPEYSKGD
ncbi:hypothetical protein [Phaffia rhodozyma]|uniref:Uncharacterized protein n=1 Tax=Phaffia rhodozyma TaxID=264483 RepID=A0A0F7SSN0_PHARH|nr:hypothetical protein [Phaffia rhodozyma]